MQTSESSGARRCNTESPRGRAGPGAQACRDPEIIEGYLRDASGQVGFASALFRPENEADVARILADAHRERVAVTVVAGQTSTTASSVPHGGWVLSTERLAHIVDVDADDLSARCGAGMMLGAFQDHLAEMDLVYPPDPTSRYECTLGGSVACNASGPRSHRYGPTRRWVRGLRVVLACGEVLEIRRGEWVARRGEYFEIVHDRDPARCADQTSFAPGAPRISRVPVPGFAPPAGIKNAAGYFGGSEVDLIDLLIGSEGTLGVVTEVEVELLPRAAGWLSMFAFFPDESSALDLIERARDRSSRAAITRPDCIEWFDAASLRLIGQAMPEFGIPERAELALFIEQSFLDAELDSDRDAELEAQKGSKSGVGVIDASDLDRHWLDLLERCGALVDLPGGVRVAQTAEQHEELRRVRHAVPSGVNERVARNGMPKLGTDLSVTDDDLRAVVALYHRAAEQPLQLLEESALRELMAELGCEIAANESITDRDLRACGLPETLDVITFGHVADNHLHVNFLPQDAAGLALARKVYAHLTQVVIEMGGSPSAEHGIGKIKRAALRQRVGDTGIAEMLAVKRAFDPRGCLGPGNLFEEAEIGR